MTAKIATVVLVVLAAGFGLAWRLPDLNLRRMHTDEAVHAAKFNTLWETGRYTYDPHDFHGPTLYYLTWPARWCSGAADFAATTAATYRSVPVACGVALILLTLLLADGLGRGAAILAAVLLAVEPTLIFYSRYYIQETLFVLWTGAVIAAVWRYAQRPRIGWAIVAGIGVGLMHATKETCILHWAALLIALAVCFWPAWRQKEVRQRYLRRGPLLAALVAAVITSVMLFSVFFTQWANVPESLWTFFLYPTRAGGVEHRQPWDTFLRMLLYRHDPPGPIWSEAPLVLLALIGAGVAWWRRSATGLPRFLAVYTFLILLIYSAIPYKTPWCMVSVVYGLALLAGVGAAALLRAGWRIREPGWRMGATAAALLIVAGTGAQLADQSRAACYTPALANDIRNPYIYAHPVGDIERLRDYLTQLAAAQPADTPFVIQVVMPDPWPLPWYLRAFPHVGYWEEVPTLAPTAVVIGAAQWETQMTAQLPAGRHVSYYGVRRDATVFVSVAPDVRQRFETAANAAAGVTTTESAP